VAGASAGKYRSNVRLGSGTEPALRRFLSHNEHVPTTRSDPAVPGEGPGQRERILGTALSLMSQHGVTGTSMRSLAAATGLNVATLYYYFPSKRDLLVAVLEERGFLTDPAVDAPPALTQDLAPTLADLLTNILVSMLEVEDFIRLMLGEVMRGDETARAVGTELFAATEASLEDWLVDHRPRLSPPGEEAMLARMLRSVLVGLVIEHVAGVLDGERGPTDVMRARAEEIALLLERSRAD
jgi:AcrR family transcriptional regulator